jgi:hypothetical protein
MCLSESRFSNREFLVVELKSMCWGPATVFSQYYSAISASFASCLRPLAQLLLNGLGPQMGLLGDFSAHSFASILISHAHSRARSARLDISQLPAWPDIVIRAVHYLPIPRPPL